MTSDQMILFALFGAVFALLLWVARRRAVAQASVDPDVGSEGV